MHEPSGYLLYKYAGRPVFAIPALASNFRQAAIKRFQPTTWRRGTYRGIVHASMLLGMDFLLNQTIESPAEVDSMLSDEWTLFLSEMADHLGVSRVDAAVFWPPQPDRKRIYVHLFDKHSRPIGYAKVSLSLSSSTNALLRHEGLVLSAFSEIKPISFKVPQFISYGSVANYTYLLLSPLPQYARPVSRRRYFYPAACVREYAGPTSRFGVAGLHKLSWWNKYLSVIDERCRAFHDELLETLSIGEISICMAHGDLSNNNIVRCGSEIWIFDWEGSVPDAPVRTDEIGYYLATNQPNIRRNPHRGTKLVKRKYLTDATPDMKASFMIALAFRVASDIDDASLIIQNWRNA
jgi:hypothetical protein